MIDRILAKLTINAVIVALLVGALVVQTIRIEGFKIWPLSIKGMKAENSELRRTIKDLQSQSKQKQSQVKEVIKQGKDRIVVVEKEVAKIENAPLPGGCRTPDAVLNSDI